MDQQTISDIFMIFVKEKIDREAIDNVFCKYAEKTLKYYNKGKPDKIHKITLEIYDELAKMIDYDSYEDFLQERYNMAIKDICENKKKILNKITEWCKCSCKKKD